MPSISQIAGGASLPLSVGMALMKVPTPYTIAAGTALSLVGLVDKIGQGRKAADKFTGAGAPQDIINKQLAAISSAQATPEEKAQAAEKAWTDFLTAANQFAAANPKQSKVVTQAIYQTPALTNTVQGLLGKNPLDPAYTNVVAPGIAQGQAQPNPGPNVGGTLLRTAAAVGAPLAINALQNRVPVNQVGQVGGQVNPTTGLPIPGGSVAAPGAAPTGGTSSLLSRLLPNLISSGTSLISGAIQSRAAGQAATTQSDTALEVARIQADAGREASQLTAKTAADNLAFNRETLEQQQKNLQPWLDAGTGALRTIGEITNQPGWTGSFKPPTPEEAAQDPATQFQLQQGARALEASLRSKGLSLSGAAAKEIQALGQGIASQGYQRVRENAVGDYERAYNTFVNERASRLNPQLAVAGFGQTATGNLNSAQGRAAELGTDISTGATRAIGDIGISTARGVGDLQTQAANARASGYVGGANAWGGAVSNIGNNILDTVTMQQILQRLGR